MKAVVQRVREASVVVAGEKVGAIGPGLMVLIGIGKEDIVRDLDWMIDKIVNLRIFEVEQGRLDKSLLDIGGSLLLVSQFTLYGDCRKGRRPSFSEAMAPEEARRLFDLFVEKARGLAPMVETGVFQASMEVSLVNSGPVTILLDSRS